MRQGLTITALGALAGLAIGIAAVRSLAALVLGVSTSDPVTAVAATLVLMATALLASYLPARRAASIDAVRTSAEL